VKRRKEKRAEKGRYKIGRKEKMVGKSISTKVGASSRGGKRKQPLKEKREYVRIDFPRRHSRGTEIVKNKHKNRKRKRGDREQENKKPPPTPTPQRSTNEKGGKGDQGG